MSHNHPIYDDDKRFSIDPVTRIVTIPDGIKPVLVQHDHNSEHITFECGRFVEGHDLLLSDKVEVHYTNSTATSRNSSRGVYPVVDLKKHDADDSKVMFTWILSEHATRFVGPLKFSITFTCLDVADITYRWSTNVNSDLSVSECVDNGEAVEGTYADVLEMWKQDLFGIGDTEEASMRRVSQEQQEAIVEKGRSTLDTIPDEYADLQDNVNTFDKDIEVLTNLVLNKNTISDFDIVQLVLNTGYFMNNSGVPTAIENSNYCVSEAVNVNPGEIFMIYGYNYAENPTYAFFDEYGNIVARNKDYNVGYGTITDNVLAIAPRNAATIKLNGNDTYPPVLKRLTSYCNPISGYVRNTIQPFINNAELETESIALVNNTAVCLISGKITSVESGDTRFVVTDAVEVEEGSLYLLECSAFSNCDAYAFYNEGGSLIDSLKNTSETYMSFENVIVAPQNARTLRLSSTYGEGTISLHKITTIKSYGNLLWSDKKWVAVGDSLTEANLRATKNYHDYVAESTGITVVNMGASGTGYLRTHDEGKAFYQRISSVPLDADVITIFGSGNDLAAGELGSVDDTGTSTLCGAINTTLDNLFAILPLAKVGLVTPTPWGSYKPGNNNAMELYSEAIVQICKNRGIPCLDLYHCSGLRPWDANYLPLAYSRDEGNSVHPDENGHAIIAPRFKAFLETLIM